MKKKNLRVRTGAIVLFCLLLTGYIVAQEQLIIEKDISIEAKEDARQKADLLVEWLVNNTNGRVQFRNYDSDKIIVEGDIPLLLDKSPFILSSQFNGNIEYRLDISYCDHQIKLYFSNLHHHSRHSINGWDFDMGLLQTNFRAQKKPILKNFDYLSEDYSRLSRFKSDKQMARLVCKKTLETIDQTINQIH